MTPIRLLAIFLIVALTGSAWFLLGGALTVRTQNSNAQLAEAVAGNWGQPMLQFHPRAFYISPTAARSKREIQPEVSNIEVNLQSDPKQKGLLWYRTYVVDFAGEYVIKNPTPISQTIYVTFQFPAEETRFDQFSFRLGDEETGKSPQNGEITEAVILEPDEETTVRLTYTAAGMDQWMYAFGEATRVRGVELVMNTNFNDIDIPAGSESPTSREENAKDGWTLTWNYQDVIGARAIAMEMPAVTNPGPVAARMTFFAPISLIFFFSVLLILGSIQGVNLHPMNYFLLAAGCFAFQLLFAYLVDLLPVMVSFAISASVSLVLVTGYLFAVAGFRFARVAAVAQLAYMILFSYSFFFDGLTGITITVGAVVTLAILMAFTAKVDWSEVMKPIKKEPGQKAPPTPPMSPGSAPAS
ncbi:MAG: inner membrane CreD family protein [Verrucomicrobiota bacterium]